MSILAQQIEQLRSRMQEIAQNEGRCVAELADALKQADENLQNEVAELAKEERAPPQLQLQQTIPLNRSVHGDRRNEILDREINNHLRHRRAS
jgi:hypothetical protein